MCTGKFVFIPAKGNMKVCMQLIWEDQQGIVDINHLLMRFHHHVNLICGGSSDR